LAFFGEKDFQQLQVIKAMVTDLSMNLRVIGVNTTRESDGLAMSSRNQYLNPQQRALAPILYQQLNLIADAIEHGRRDFSALVAKCKAQLVEQGFNPDYIEIRNAESLLPPGHEDTDLVILAAAFLGKTRLIDNIQIQL
jgi:pantoate--beta-alanine ligase